MRRIFRRLSVALLAAAFAASSSRAAAPARLILPVQEPVFASAACAACGALGAVTAPSAVPPWTLSVPALAPTASLAPPAAALPAPPAPRLFAAAAPAVEGAAVSPRLLDPSVGERDLPRQVEAVRASALGALRALRESVALGGWNGEGTKLDGPCCGDAAPKLAVMLRGHGLPARLVEAEFHYYVMLDLPEGQIVVDPTVRQFFGRGDAPPDVPTVFVGTIPQLHELFRRHASAKTTKYEPSRIYFSDARVRETGLLALDDALRSGAAAEHEPIRRFLSVPPPPFPEPARLVVH